MGAAAYPRGLSGRLELLLGAERHLGDLEIGEPVAADEDLVAVAQASPVDALAVDEDAVERAVVEHAHAVGLADDQRVAAADGRVVEADVGGQRAADARPLLGQRDRDDAAAVLVDEVLAGGRRAGACTPDPFRALVMAKRGGRPAGEGGGGAEERGAREARPAAAGAVGQAVAGNERDDVSTFLAAERPGPRKGARRQ